MTRFDCHLMSCVFMSFDLIRFGWMMIDALDTLDTSCMLLLMGLILPGRQDHPSGQIAGFLPESSGAPERVT